MKTSNHGLEIRSLNCWTIGLALGGGVEGPAEGHLAFGSLLREGPMLKCRQWWADSTL